MCPDDRDNRIRRFHTEASSPIRARVGGRSGVTGKRSPSSPATPAVGDQRTYLHIEVDKDTAAPRQTGLTVGVRLRGDSTLYRSDHGEPSWSVERDVPAATTVELPAGPHRPQQSFFSWHGSVTLTPTQPQATLLSA